MCQPRSSRPRGRAGTKTDTVHLTEFLVGASDAHLSNLPHPPRTGGQRPHTKPTWAPAVEEVASEWRPMIGEHGGLYWVWSVGPQVPCMACP